MSALFFLSILLFGCAETRIYRDGRIAAIIQGDATNVTFKSGDVYFHADTLVHSAATSAAYGGATSLVGGIGAGIASAALGLGVKP